MRWRVSKTLMPRRNDCGAIFAAHGLAAGRCGHQTAARSDPVRRLVTRRARSVGISYAMRKLKRKMIVPGPPRILADPKRSFSFQSCCRTANGISAVRVILRLRNPRALRLWTSARRAISADGHGRSRSLPDYLCYGILQRLSSRWYALQRAASR